jgi:cytochrome c peroxidase
VRNPEHRLWTLAVPASAMPNMPHLFGEREVARCGGDVAHVSHPYRTNRYKPGEDPLFTDFTASNIGTPANPRLPYYAEDRADVRGYVANPAGSSFVDLGVGRFLTQTHLLSQPSPVDARWLPLVPDNQGRFRVPTLRNVDKRPDPTFVKAYGHNGYFKSLKAIVPFYNAGHPAALSAQ